MAKKETLAPNKDKDAALESALRAIEKTYGKGSVMRMGEKPHVDVDVVPSGSLLLDQAIGIGGYPKGRIIEIFGPESSGKTTLALHAVAESQKKGGRAAYIDAEHAIDPEYAAKLGVDINELILSQPDSGEQALEIVEMLAESGAIDVIVVDSVAALVPQQELDGVMSDNQVGLQARLMSKAMRKLAGILGKTNCLVIFINQPGKLGYTEEPDGFTEMIISKNRAGETGIINLSFNGDLVKFTERTDTLYEYAEKSTAAAQAKPRPTAWDQVTGAVGSYDPFAAFEDRYPTDFR